MSAFSIRRADVNDLDQVARLFDLYRAFYKKPDEGAKARDFLRQRLTNQESVIFVAECEGGELVGFTQLYPTFSSLGLSRVWILNDLYVEAAYRRHKIGRALMEAAHDFARSTGATFIQLETAKTNHAAQALYRSLGYEAEDHYMMMSLSL